MSLAKAVSKKLREGGKSLKYRLDTALENRHEKMLFQYDLDDNGMRKPETKRLFRMWASIRSIGKESE